jgi:hypothetical protein
VQRIKLVKDKQKRLNFKPLRQSFVRAKDNKKAFLLELKTPPRGQKTREDVNFYPYKLKKPCTA